MGIVVGIDVGGSTTKIVGFSEKVLLQPLFVKANDPIASIYGAFGKFAYTNKISINQIDKVMITGVGSSYISSQIYGLETSHVSEFTCTGKGGLYLSECNEAIVVSMGTGTALVYAKDSYTEYLGGTGVGGGTLVGLSKKMLGVQSVDIIVDMASNGSLDKIDLKIKDITKKNIIPTLPPETTASNFGRLSDIADNSDIALGIVNLVCETVAMMSIFAARQKGIRDIILTGNLSAIPQAKQMFSAMSEMFGVSFRIPENSQFATVIGAALSYYD